MADNTERDLIAETVKEELARILAESNGETRNQTQNKPEPITLNLGGQTYQFDTKEQMESALTHTFQTFRGELEKRNEVAKPKEGGYVSGTEEERFDQSKYIDLMGQDVVKAHNYALDHALGIPNAAQVLKANLSESNNLKATVAVYQFRELHPEFPMTAEATKVVDGIRRELNQPFTLQGLEAAYGVAQTRGLVASPQVLAYQRELIEKGILPDPAKQQQQTQQRPNPALNGPLGYQPPPSVSRNSQAPANDLASMADNMSLEQLEKALRNAGQL